MPRTSWEEVLGDYEGQNKKNKMGVNKEYKINRIKRLGYKVTPLGRNICAEKNNTRFSGSVNSVYKQIFG